MTGVRKDPRSHNECFLGGSVVRRGRANATVEITVRFSPTGPWFTQAHKVPLSVILSTVNTRD